MVPHDIPPDLKETLCTLADTLNALTDQWMIFGGAALALHGVSDGPVSDVDIVVSGQVAENLASGLSACRTLPIRHRKGFSQTSF